MEIKPRIFIGSSTEGLSIAESLKNHFSSWAECDIWNERNIFLVNKSNLENLDELLGLYEYGVMIATGDDQVYSRGESNQAVRDNILFEFGLFMGRLGRERTFYVCEEGIRVPSDLHGISLLKVPNSNGDEKEIAIRENASRIRDYIESNTGIFQGGIFPSVPLAYGYYNNFISVVCEKLLLARSANIDGEDKPINDFAIHIMIPDNLTSDMKKKITIEKNIQEWQRVRVEVPEIRSYDFFADVSFDNNGKAILRDVPTTLLSLHQTIVEFLRDKHLGNSERKKIVEAREIRRFKAVLDFLIQQDKSTRGRVITEIVDI
jgi:hypothetical protein